MTRPRDSRVALRPTANRLTSSLLDRHPLHRHRLRPHALVSTEWRAAALIALALVGTTTRAQEAPSDPAVDSARDTIRLKLQLDLTDPSRKSRIGAVSFARADAIDGTTDTDVTLTGHAELRRAGGDVFTADRMHYVNVDDELFANGAVHIVRDGNTFNGPELRIKLDDYSGYFLKPVFTLGGFANRAPKPETQIITAAGDPLYAYRNPVAPNRVGFLGRGDATRATFIDRDHLYLDDPLYTTCRADNYDWYIKAESMTLDQATQTGEAHNAKIVFKGVPILATPYLSFPLDDSRKSGLLPPTVSVTSHNGLEYLQPYYFNLAPNYDLTLYPKVISARGLQVGGDARYLSPTLNSDMRAEGIADDRLDGGKGRYSLSTITRFNSGPVSGYVNAAKVSDDNYFVDFSRTIALSSQRVLPQEAAVTYTGSFWYLTAHELRYQTLQDPAAPITPPYDKSPEILMHAAKLDVLGGFDFNLDVNATRFTSPVLPSGERYLFKPSVAFPILRPGWFVTPKVAYDYAYYHDINVAAGTPSEFSRSLPTYTVDSGLVFERETSLFGRNLLQTVEPRLFYVKTPYRNQDALPNYDSGITDFNFSQLFAANPFGGEDRIADANVVTAAISTRFINNEDGAEIFRASLGQRYYLAQQRVTLPGAQPISSSRSDVLAEINGQVLRSLVLDAGGQYSQATQSLIRSNIGFSYRPEPTKVVNIDYRSQKATISQPTPLEAIDVSAQWPLFRNVYAVGRLNYSMRDHKPIEALAGFEYGGCCWVVRVVGSRYVTGTQTATSTLFLQLELNGLARLGSNPLESLKRNVPGYQLVNTPPASGSPYRGYQ